MDLNLTSPSYGALKAVVAKHHQKAKQKFAEKHAEALKFLSVVPLERIREHSTKLLASAALTTNMLLPTPTHLLPTPKPVPIPTPVRHPDALLALDPSQQEELVATMKSILPEEVGPISSGTEQQLSDLFSRVYGIKAVPELEGMRLNYTYGRTGYEQHLPRYSGDSIDQHDEWLEEGITPGLGAWGYFALSKEAMTKEDYLREKYYLVAQTWLSPNWTTDSNKAYEWFKYRKMVMVNPENGRAVVGVLGDAGPATWTGKVFGASPAAMYYLRAHEGMRNEKVVLYFVDDPENKIPLGPVVLEEDRKVAAK